MPGLDPGIHVFIATNQDVDHRVSRRHGRSHSLAGRPAR